MTFRFFSLLPDGTVADFAVDALTLRAAFDQFKTSPWPTGATFAVWCGRRLAGYVVIDDGPVLTDLKTSRPAMRIRSPAGIESWVMGDSRRGPRPRTTLGGHSTSNSQRLARH